VSQIKKLGVFVERAVQRARLASKPAANTEVASGIKGNLSAKEDFFSLFFGFG